MAADAARPRARAALVGGGRAATSPSAPVAARTARCRSPDAADVRLRPPAPAHRRPRALRARRWYRRRDRARLLRRRRRPRARGDGAPAAADAAGARPHATLPRLPRSRPGAGRRASTTAATSDRRWTDEPGVEDCWGRALWGLGTAAAAPADPRVRSAALAEAALGAPRRSPCRRDGLRRPRRRRGARRCTPAPGRTRPARGRRTSARPATGRVAGRGPSARLTYANAVLPEALLAIGARWATTSTSATRAAPAGLAGRRRDRATGTCRSTPGGRLGTRRTRGPASTSSPSRSRRWPRPAAGRFAVTRRRSSGSPCLDRCVAWFLGDNDAGCRSTTASPAAGTTACTRADVTRTRARSRRWPLLSHAASWPSSRCAFGASDGDPFAARASGAPHVLRPDPRRVLAKLFLPGQETIQPASRAGSVLDRVLALSDAAVAQAPWPTC